ncbi:protein Mo7 [Beluga whale alphaherpesvirus 1]|uniref:Protein Mo7 n=1 Tax=Beluga whale alphaherpesvirus 1 TaxID=1434720 RepID=A0A286MM96_9ALPH|nr:protein Mo7 [Beluga whale alphaherpesvirus 1]ASW27122.1 protein Mo7 [Beluga whale alphaherpesvirus 1]
MAAFVSDRWFDAYMGDPWSEPVYVSLTTPLSESAPRGTPRRAPSTGSPPPSPDPERAPPLPPDPLPPVPDSPPPPYPAAETPPSFPLADPARGDEAPGAPEDARITATSVENPSYLGPLLLPAGLPDRPPAYDTLSVALPPPSYEWAIMDDLLASIAYPRLGEKECCNVVGLAALLILIIILFGVFAYILAGSGGGMSK